MADFLRVDVKGLGGVTKLLMGLPGAAAKAKKAALGSCGNLVRSEMKGFIEKGGEGWQQLHPITPRLRKRKLKKTPYFWLARFVRYRTSEDGTTIGIGLGKSHKGRPGQIDDPWTNQAARTAEFGAKVAVTHFTRRAWIRANYGISNRYKRGVRSGAYIGRIRAPRKQFGFHLRQDTETLTIPPRRIFGPVMARVGPRITPHFERRFWPALEAYAAGRSPRDRS